MFSFLVSVFLFFGIAHDIDFVMKMLSRVITFNPLEGEREIYHPDLPLRAIRRTLPFSRLVCNSGPI